VSALPLDYQVLVVTERAAGKQQESIINDHAVFVYGTRNEGRWVFLAPVWWQSAGVFL